MIVQVSPEYIEYDKTFKNLCRAPFYRHSKGCPNWNRKEGCPPNVLPINEILDFNKDLYVIYTVFNVGEFAERMRLMHPEWRDYPRQWYNPRRWQPAARKLHVKDKYSAMQIGIDTILSSPEASGVNVTNLMSKINITLNWEWPPKHILRNDEYKKNLSYIISLGGYRK